MIKGKSVTKVVYQFDVYISYRVTDVRGYEKCPVKIAVENFETGLICVKQRSA